VWQGAVTLPPEWEESLGGGIIPTTYACRLQLMMTTANEFSFCLIQEIIPGPHLFVFKETEKRAYQYSVLVKPTDMFWRLMDVCSSKVIVATFIGVTSRQTKYRTEQYNKTAKLNKH
jgi:hypothetical protein